VFVHFEGKRASDMAPSRYAARHLIANEMQAELARRGDSGEALSHTASDIISAYKVYVPDSARSPVNDLD
jgi:chromosome transmission fidelity protein 18